jgi:LacI family transcriptional regulator
MIDRKKITIKDISKHTGLSVATVSRVVNNTGKNYSKKSEKLIKSAVKKLKYTPNIIARSLKNQKTNTIGFVVPELDSFYTEIFLGAQDVALKYKYSNFLCNTNYNIGMEKLYLENLLTRQVDGVIFTTGLLDNSLVHNFLKAGIPIVLIESFLENPDIIKIILDNYKYSKIAVKHLLDNGYKKIGFISAPLEMQSIKDRYRGYIDTLNENKIPFDKSMVYFSNSIRGEWDLTESGKLIEKIMSGTNHPDALFIISDAVAMVAIQIIKKMGFNIPKDVGIVGFDDRRICKYLDPPLTSVFQPKYEMGARGMDLLIKVIEGEEIKERKIYLDMRLSIRQSSNKKFDSPPET